MRYGRNGVNFWFCLLHHGRWEVCGGGMFACIFVVSNSLAGEIHRLLNIFVEFLASVAFDVLSYVKVEKFCLEFSQASKKEKKPSTQTHTKSGGQNEL